MQTEKIIPAKRIENPTANINEKSGTKIKFLNKILKETGVNFLLHKPQPRPSILSLKEGGETLNILPKGIVEMLVGPGAVGKTHFLTQLALSVAGGGKFLRKYDIANKGNVCLILGENTENDIHWLIEKTFKHLYTNTKTQEEKDEVLNQLAIMSTTGQDASFINKKQKETVFYTNLLKDLQSQAPENGWDLIILDPISRFLGPDAEIDNAAATQFIALLEKMILNLKGNPAILFGHHMNKSGLSGTATHQGAARGSSAITDGVRWQANLERILKEGEEKEFEKNKIKLRFVKSNFTKELEPVTLTKDAFGNLTAKNKKAATQSKPKKEELQDEFFKNMDELAKRGT